MKPKNKQVFRDEHRAAVLAALLDDLAPWHHQCHAASIAIVRARVFPEARVARGVCRGVGGQHSWVVLGNDCFDETAAIVDPTLWSYDESVTGVWYGSYRDARHVPHGGFGSIWEWGRPPNAAERPVTLTPRRPFSAAATRFLALVEPLDRWGWARLSSAPPGGWPAAKIITAMADTAELDQLIPIDVLGMVTELNPSELYLAPKEKP